MTEEESGLNLSLRHKLVLFRYLLDTYFGVRDFEEIRKELSGVEWGIGDDGQIVFSRRLAEKNLLKLKREKILQYDENIAEYVKQIGSGRDGIELKYFQYMAVLLTEIYLDNYMHNQEVFLSDADSYIKEVEEGLDLKETFVTPKSLNKLVYWMATGSGKTLIMHINYLQYQKYRKKPLDNILLITPNESLTNQHLDEFRKSGIRAKRFSEGSSDGESVSIIEISKLTSEKKGKGVSVDVSSFEGNNLVFVDEGHRGLKSGKKWKELRDKITEIGFTFEYSATFDEAISGSQEDLLKEYERSIIMDYSYHYFYKDGMGKDFRVLNLKDAMYTEKKQEVLTANLLSFYQQLRYFDDKKEELKEFQLKKPLWIFVGSSVNKPNATQTITDVQEVVEFIREFLKDKKNFQKKINGILTGKFVLEGDESNINVKEWFGYLTGKGSTASGIYDDIIQLVFNSPSRGKLEFYDIVNAPGEIGVKVSTSDQYFGLVYVGDTSQFKKRMDKNGHTIKKDISGPALFESTKTDSSPINLLMGSKKFIEGWDNYRISSMGLMNVGGTKGPQIIQLFGRGVRLKGYNDSLKRTSAIRSEIATKIPENIEILETLNIFGVHADYVKKFKKALEKEGIKETRPFRVEINKKTEFLDKGLVTLRKKEGALFEEEILLELDNRVVVDVDLTPHFEMYESEGGRGANSLAEENKIDWKDYAELIDWERLYLELYEYKRKRGMYNLRFNINDIKKVLLDGEKIYTSAELTDMPSFGEFRERVQYAALRTLTSYLRQKYQIQKREWLTDNLVYSKLREDDASFADYVIKIDPHEEDKIRILVNNINKLKKINAELNELPKTVVFDRHLFWPLLAEEDATIISPAGLNEGEERFVEDLKKFFKEDNLLVEEANFYILRNINRRGVGFFTETNNFYPDFMIWLVRGAKQILVFVDPKGLQHIRGLDDPKIEFRKKIKEIERRLGDKNIKLESFIVSGSGFNSLQNKFSPNVTKTMLEQKHILFQEDSDYIKKLMSIALN